jgi:hypothetical protein
MCTLRPKSLDRLFPQLPDDLCGTEWTQGCTSARSPLGVHVVSDCDLATVAKTCGEACSLLGTGRLSSRRLRRPWRRFFVCRIFFA